MRRVWEGEGGREGALASCTREQRRSLHPGASSNRRERAQIASVRGEARPEQGQDANGEGTTEDSRKGEPGNRKVEGSSCWSIVSDVLLKFVSTGRQHKIALLHAIVLFSVVLA